MCSRMYGRSFEIALVEGELKQKAPQGLLVFIVSQPEALKDDAWLGLA